MHLVRCTWLDALEVVKRLEARLAPIVRFARSRAKLAHPLAVTATATRAADGGSPEQVARVGHCLRRGGDPKRLELAPATLGEPFARPRWRKRLLQHSIAISRRIECVPNGSPNYIGSRTPRICWGQTNMQALVERPLCVPHDAKLHDAEDRNLRVQDVFQHTPDGAIPGIACLHVVLCVHRHAFVAITSAGLHHCAPGYVRCRCCISVSM